MSQRSEGSGWFRHAAVWGFAVSVAVLIALVTWQGLHTIAAVLGRVEAWALLLGPAFLAPHLFHSEAWYQLAERSTAPARGHFLHANWIAFGINWLLPSARVGGDVVKAGMLRDRGMPGREAAASTVAHKTLQPVTLVAYTVLAVGCLAYLQGGSRTTAILLAVSLALAAGLAAFVYLQHRGLSAALARTAERFLTRAGEGDWTLRGRALDAALRETWGRRRRVALAVIHLLGFRVLLTLEVWWIMQLLGHPVSLAEALILDSLAQAVRSGAFMLPAGLGAQEGGFVALGVVLGVPEPVALSASLLRRLRELEVGIPALVVWQWSLSRGLLARHRGDGSKGS